MKSEWKSTTALPDPRYEWHTWFAWYPVKIVNWKQGLARWVWWEYLGRRFYIGTFGGNYTIEVEYRIP